MKERIYKSKLLKLFKGLILQVIDFFYPPFRKLLPIKTFRYAACGGSVALLNLAVFFIAINYLVDKDTNVDFGFFQMTPYIAAFTVALLVSFPAGFILNKFVVFQQSNLKGGVQLFRYATMTGLNIFLNYILLHLLVGFLGFWATPSQAATTVILAILSYFMQNYFSFKEKK